MGVIEDLRYHRKRQGIRQNKLAASLGMSRTYISQIERGEANPTLDTLQRICKQLGVELRAVDPKRKRGPTYNP